MNKLKIGHKIFFSILLTGLISSAISSYIYISDKRAEAQATAIDKLQYMTEVNKKYLEDFFADLSNNVEILAKSTNTYELINTLYDYKTSYGLEDSEPFFTKTEQWKQIYSSYNRYYKSILHLNNYQDILLVNSSGQVIFSSTEEKTLGEHLLTGRMKNTNLSTVWRKSRKTKNAVISDFDTFSPSSNLQYLFIAAPVFDNNDKYIGSIILQIASTTLDFNHTPQNENDYNYELFIVRSDYTGINSYGQNENYIINTGQQNTFIQNGFDGNKGFDEYDDIQSETYLVYYAPAQVKDVNWVILSRVKKQTIFERVNSMYLVLVLIGIGLFLVTVLLSYVVSTSLVRPMRSLEKALHSIGRGQYISQEFEATATDEISSLSRAINSLSSNLNDTVYFAKQIGTNNLDVQFEPKSDSDELGKSLIALRDNLNKAQADDESRKREDKIRNWLNTGHNRLSDILRQQSSSIQQLAEIVTDFLVHYLQANQGGLFIYNTEDPTDSYLELLASYAFDRKKHNTKRINVGEGLVGMCAIEKETVYLDEIPNDYLDITSGLGDANPRYLIIVPLKHESQLMGIIEIASFNKFEPHAIEFAERACEIIAASLSNAKISDRTSKLLLETKMQAEEMAAQEEEMRQNLEEMQATREEAARKEQEMRSIVNAIDHNLIRAEIDTNGSLLSVNNRFTAALGYTDKEVEGSFIKALLSTTDRAKKALDDIWEVVLAGEAYETEIETTSKDRSVIWLLTSFSPVFDEMNEISKIILLASDITARKKTELEMMRQSQKLKEQDEELRKNILKLQETEVSSIIKQQENENLLQSIDNTIIRGKLKENTIIEFANDNMKQLLPIEEGTTFLNSFVSHEGQADFDETWQNVCNGFNRKLTLHLTPRGKVSLWIVLSLIPIIADNKLQHIILLGVNITEQKSIAEELEVKNTQYNNQGEILKKAIVKYKEKQVEVQNKLAEKEEELAMVTSRLKDESETYANRIKLLEKQNSELKTQINTAPVQPKTPEITTELGKQINKWLNSFGM